MSEAFMQIVEGGGIKSQCGQKTSSVVLSNLTGYKQEACRIDYNGENFIAMVVDTGSPADNGTDSGPAAVITDFKTVQGYYGWAGSLSLLCNVEKKGNSLVLYVQSKYSTTIQVFAGIAIIE